MDCYPQTISPYSRPFVPYLNKMALSGERTMYRPPKSSVTLTPTNEVIATLKQFAPVNPPVINIQIETGPFAKNYQEINRMIPVDANRQLALPVWQERTPSEEELQLERQHFDQAPRYESEYWSAIEKKLREQEVEAARISERRAQEHQQEQLKQQQLEQQRRSEQERLSKEEQERLKREEQERMKREEQERLKREEQERLRREQEQASVPREASPQPTEAAARHPPQFQPASPHGIGSVQRADSFRHRIDEPTAPTAAPSPNGPSPQRSQSATAADPGAAGRTNSAGGLSRANSVVLSDLTSPNESAPGTPALLSRQNSMNKGDVMGISDGAGGLSRQSSIASSSPSSPLTSKTAASPAGAQQQAKADSDSRRAYLHEIGGGGASPSRTTPVSSTQPSASPSRNPSSVAPQASADRRSFLDEIGGGPSPSRKTSVSPQKSAAELTAAAPTKTAATNQSDNTIVTPRKFGTVTTTMGATTAADGGAVFPTANKSASESRSATPLLSSNSSNAGLTGNQSTRSPSNSMPTFNTPSHSSANVLVQQPGEVAEKGDRWNGLMSRGNEKTGLGCFGGGNFIPEQVSPGRLLPENFSTENASPSRLLPENFSTENLMPGNLAPENFSAQKLVPGNFRPGQEGCCSIS